jgi:hypothetical protein
MRREGGRREGGRREDVLEMVVVRERKRCVVLWLKLYKCVTDPIEFTALKHGDCGYYLRYGFCTGTVVRFPDVPLAFLHCSEVAEHAYVTFMKIGRAYEGIHFRDTSV